MLILNFITILQYLNIEGSLPCRESPYSASPETILWFYLFGKCRQIPGQEFEHTVLKPHEKRERARERGRGMVIIRRGRVGADGTPASVWEIFDALQTRRGGFSLALEARKAG